MADDFGRGRARGRGRGTPAEPRPLGGGPIEPQVNVNSFISKIRICSCSGMFSHCVRLPIRLAVRNFYIQSPKCQWDARTPFSQRQMYRPTPVALVAPAVVVSYTPISVNGNFLIVCRNSLQSCNLNFFSKNELRQFGERGCRSCGSSG